MKIDPPHASSKQIPVAGVISAPGGAAGSGLGKQPFWRTFGKAQVSSLAASSVDFSALFILVELSGVFYAYAVALGALAGAVTNFLLNRNWSFQAQDGKPTEQAWRYAQVSITGLGLNVAGTYALTEAVGFQYGLSRIITSLLVGFFFNFPLHRRYVFK